MTTATATPKAEQNGAASRMGIGSIRKDVARGPDRIQLTGTEGIGKTTFAADAPSPIFLCAEDGIPAALGGVPRFPEPKTLKDVHDAIRTLVMEDHPYRTFAVDTLDWLEPIIWADLCTRNKWESIETPGYGKGYTAAAEEWRKILAGLDVLRNKRGMEIILLSHAAIRTFQNPAGSDYSRYECKLNKNAAALVREWTDVNLFAIHEEFIKLNSSGKETKRAVSTGRRVIHTERTAAWDAKNRHGLPAELPLNYADYAAARAAGQPADPDTLRQEAENLIAALKMGEADLNQTKQVVVSAYAQGAGALARVVDRLRSKVAEQGEV